MMDHKPVRIISTEMVKPTKCLDQNPPKLKLTPFDNCMENVPYQQRVLFYNKPLEAATNKHQPEEEILQLLKRSLSETLVVFYPLAGRITKDEEGSPVIDCGAGQSVKFFQATTDATLEQLGELFEPSDFCDSLCDMDSSIPKNPWTLDDPLLLVQVTMFRCGGMSLGFAFNHQAMDGTSAWHFMNSWADVARNGEVQAAPEISFSFKTLDLTPEQAAKQKKRMGFQVPSLGIPGKPEGLKLVTKVFNVTPELIQRLKADAAAATQGTKFSSFLVVGAYFWRRVTLARQFPGSSEEVTRFIVIVNCRERIPTMPKRYFGNAASGFVARLKAGEIHSGTWLARCSTILQEGIKQCTTDNLAESIAYFRWVLSNPEELKDLNFSHNVVHPIGSHNHPVYKTEFGFGKPVGVTVGRNDLGDGKLYFFPSAKGDSGVSVTAVLPEDVMERLLDQDLDS